MLHTIVYSDFFSGSPIDVFVSPASQIIDRGDRALFNCSAEGESDLMFRWLYIGPCSNCSAVPANSTVDVNGELLYTDYYMLLTFYSFTLNLL